VIEYFHPAYPKLYRIGGEYAPWLARLFGAHECYMFGCGLDGHGLVYRPRIGKEPNAFVRWMMKICFDCTWVKTNG
jgi:hypothetical protein